MKKKLNMLMLILCLVLFICTTAFATNDTGETAESIPTSEESTNTQDVGNIEQAEIIIEGLEGVNIVEIKDIILSSSKSSCGINHAWNVSSVIQEGTCDKQGIYKVQCTNCGATGTVYTDAPGHNYVNGVCTVCGEKQGVEVAPAVELAKWTYELDEVNKTITLKKYVSDVTDVIVFGAYKVNGVVYSTILNNSSRLEFFGKPEIITSVIINNGVSSTCCAYLFFECVNLIKVDLSGLDTSKVRDMSEMFNSCKNLKEINSGNFNTSNVTNMFGMFWDCNKLESLDLSSFDTSNVTDMNRMFFGCSNLTALDVSNFNTSKVDDMGWMFYRCSKLENLNIENFDTSNTKNMDSMFSNCTNLLNLNISKFNTLNVTYMLNMFCGCSNLTSLDLSSFQTYNTSNMSRMFYNCTKLTSIYVNRAKWNTSFADTTEMFTGCATSKVTPK